MSSPRPAGVHRKRSAPSLSACLLLALASFLVPLSGCVNSSASVGAPGAFRVLGDPATSGAKAWPASFDNSPKPFDIDGDGVDEIIVHGNDTKVYVFALDGRTLAVLPTKYPPSWYRERILNGVEAGVLNPGEPVSLVITNHAAYVSAWRFDPGQSSRERFVFTKTFESRMTACYPSPGMDAKATLADLDKDRSLEILVQTEEKGFFALRPDGTTLWKQCWGGGNSAPVAGDLDGDGSVEVVVASDAGFITVLAGATGAILWTYDAKQAGISPASIPAAPTIADLDGKAPMEILFTARHAPNNDASQFGSFRMAVFAIRQNPETWQSELVWMRQPTWANPLSNTRLVVRDVDGDGSPDIFGMDWNTIGHRPGNWERLGPAHVFRLDANGNDVWVREIDAWWSNQDIAVSDVNGDGKVDVLVNGPGEGGDGVWRLSSATGTAEAFIPVSPWELLRGPIIADLRHDGRAWLLFPVEPMDTTLRRGAVLVFELGVPYEA